MSTRILLLRGSVIGATVLMVAFIDSLLATNAGWGASAEFQGLPGRTAVKLATGFVLLLASVALFKPKTPAILSPTIVAALTTVAIRPLFLLDGPLDLFLSDRSALRWYLLASYLLQISLLVLAWLVYRNRARPQQ